MVAKDYRYELLKGSKHIICPNCQKKTFKPYVDSETQEIVDAEKFGRCERINSCGYIAYPDIKGGDLKDWTPPPPQPYQEPIPDLIPREIIEATFHSFKQNVFFMWLVHLFGMDKAYELQTKYNIGTAKNGGTIFWQQDSDGNFRTGKVMYYQPNGKRDKDRKSWYVHKKLERERNKGKAEEERAEYTLVQVFFGEHLIRNDTPLALCESEKTAILMSIFQPEYTWIAAGGANMLNLYRLGRLPRLDFVSPDNGQFRLWENQTKIFNGRQMDVRVDQAVREGRLGDGADILDLYLIEGVKPNG